MKEIHYQADVLERFIPISLDMLIADLLSSGLLANKQIQPFEQFCQCYIALFHAQAHSKISHLKHIYQPFNPDRDTLIIDKKENQQSLALLKKELYTVLEDANYEKISKTDLNEALNKTSPHGVKVSVDFDEFMDVALFYRGSAIQTEYHRSWKQFNFKKQAVNIQIYRRLFILLQPKTKQQWVEHLTKDKKMSLKKAQKKADENLKNQGISDENSVVYMKLFKDIPRHDLEMLFPNTRIQMRLFDKLKLGIMGGGGTAGGIMATISKFSAVIDPISAVFAITGLLGVIWRQIAKVFSQRAKYSAILTKNLYFYSLDTNMGALSYLVDSAETEECKEAILAYFFLLITGESSHQALDQRIEHYIQEQYAIPMDFEIEDGLNKLNHSQLLSRYDEIIHTVSLDEANKRLIQQWHDLVENKNKGIIT